MKPTEQLTEQFVDEARDIKLNLAAVMENSSLTPEQTWATAVASAYAARAPALTQAILAQAKESGLSDAGLSDAKAAAALMGMNNIYYRFKHMIGKEVYQTKPAKLRMQRIAKTAGPKAEFELYCLAVSAINGCEACLRSHEEVVLHGGLTEDQVNDAVRIASTVHAAAIAHEISTLGA